MNSHKKPTINDVAKLAQVGKTSVSRYLNGEFNVLSDKIQEQIRTAITTLNYKPSQIARSMKRGNTKLIALVFADLSIPYAIDIMQGVEAACRKYGYTLLVFNANNENQQEKRILQLLSSYQVEGVIIQALRSHDHNFKNFALPIVSLDRKIYSLNCDLVHLDNIQATHLALTHLLESGFEAILFITETIHDIQARQQRADTFKQFIALNQPCFGEVLEVKDSSDEKSVDKSILRFFTEHKERKKAVIAANSVVTLNISLALRRLNLEWGKDLGVLGFDDPNWASVLGVGISTIRQPTFKIGYSAFELLLNRIKGDTSEFKTILYPGELIIRDSTKSL